MERVAPSARRGLPPASGTRRFAWTWPGSVPLGAELWAVVVHWLEVPTHGGMPQYCMIDDSGRA